VDLGGSGYVERTSDAIVYVGWFLGEAVTKFIVDLHAHITVPDALAEMHLTQPGQGPRLGPVVDRAVSVGRLPIPDVVAGIDAVAPLAAG